ncbi:unnamed protein product [Gulo gulo]|uniref:Uncharacterized protein n=1 Tax=Gulo gulo TaxID=48420 RepID=A0A9X9M875_GULGU|nr:unnamed protein product [Gulo gulo]
MLGGSRLLKPWFLASFENRDDLIILGCSLLESNRPSGWPHSPQSPPLPLASHLHSLIVPECAVPALIKGINYFIKIVIKTVL